MAAGAGLAEHGRIDLDAGAGMIECGSVVDTDNSGEVVRGVRAGNMEAV